MERRPRAEKRLIEDLPEATEEKGVVVYIPRRDFLKYCIGAAAALGLENSVLRTLDEAFASGTGVSAPTYPIASTVYTTLQKTIAPLAHGAQTLLPSQVSQYAANHYGEWNPNGAPAPYVRPNIQTGAVTPSVRDPGAATLLTFFTMSDIHIADKESPAQCIYMGYQYPNPQLPGGIPIGNSSTYSAVILYTIHVLDAAVQTINALHRTAPFDFGIALGDAANNNQYNELRWYLDVIDGKPIAPSSGAHLGAGTIDYQKPFQPAGLDKSIPWYQAIGNHDQFWMGSAHANTYVQNTYTGTGVLNLGPVTSLPPDWQTIFNTRGFYMGVVNGSTRYGDIIDVGSVSGYPTPPQIAADANRHALSMADWMREFLNTTSTPVGHGFTQQMIDNNFACYHFYPKANIPLKVIVLDDTDRIGGDSSAALDTDRLDWLTTELDAGEAAGELMIICAHIPVQPYSYGTMPANPPYPMENTFSPNSVVTDDELLHTLHNYKNLILWVAGHAHRNTITPQPSPDNDPQKGFWEVETPSLRDFPQQFRRFEIVRNSDNNISIFALDVDVAVNTALLPGGAASPACTSRSYAVATQQIFNNPVRRGPNVNASTGVYNAELVKQLSPAMRTKLANLPPIVNSFKINNDAVSTTSNTVTLNNIVIAAIPSHYMASQYPNFSGAAWLPYSQAPSFTLVPTGASGIKKVYFKVKTASGRVSEVVSDTIRG